MASFDWLNEDSRTFLSRGYLDKGQVAEERIADIANHAESILGISGFADKFYDYMSRGWFSLSSPVWSNFGNTRGLSVSCFGTYIGDSISSIIKAHAETASMTKFGGGCSATFNPLRPRGAKIGNNNGETMGPVHFMEMFQTMTDVISQGSVRRGRLSPYLDIDHPDFDEFIGIGTEGHPIQSMEHGVVASDDFMTRMQGLNGEALRRWAATIENRGEVGFPYIVFGDTMNRNTVDVYRDKKMKIHHSNLCSEIALPNSEDESFVCVLSSMNLLHYDEWKDTDAVETLTMFLDAVVTDFINRIDSLKDTDLDMYRNMERARRFAVRHRALGLGMLGWHSYLQTNSIPFESELAFTLNAEIAKTINTKAWQASKQLAAMFGEPEVLEGYGRRNTTLTAIAPTKSSSAILGQVSPSIEPYRSNYFVDDKAKLKITFKNPILKRRLEELGYDTPDVWRSIRAADGSVQHLEFLSDHDKDVYKTFGEINPEAVIDQAADRQKHVDQAQSLNLLIGPSMDPRQVNRLYLRAYHSGVKSLYYQYSVSAAQEFARSLGCVSCEA